MLRIGGDLFDAAADIVRTTAAEQDQGAIGRSAGNHRDRQYWMPDASGSGQPNTGSALD